MHDGRRLAAKDVGGAPRRTLRTLLKSVCGLAIRASGFRRGRPRGSSAGSSARRLGRRSEPTAPSASRRLRARFAEVIAEQRAQDDRAGPQDESETTPLPLVEGEDPLSVLADLDRLEPCGVSNPRPQLVVEGSLRSAREVKGGHLKLELDLCGKVLGGFAVAMGSRAAELRGRVALRGDLRHTTFPGSSGVEMFVAGVGEFIGEPTGSLHDHSC